MNTIDVDAAMKGLEALAPNAAEAQAMRAVLEQIAGTASKMDKDAYVKKSALAAGGTIAEEAIRAWDMLLAAGVITPKSGAMALGDAGMRLAAFGLGLLPAEVYEDIMEAWIVDFRKEVKRANDHCAATGVQLPIRKDVPKALERKATDTIETRSPPAAQPDLPQAHTSA